MPRYSRSKFSEWALENKGLSKSIQAAQSNLRPTEVHETLEDFAFTLAADEEKRADQEYRKLEKAIESFTEGVLRHLYPLEVYPSYILAASILYRVLREKKSACDEKSIIRAFIDDIDAWGGFDPALVIFPIYDFGIQGLGHFRLSEEVTYFSRREVFVSPQANSADALRKTLETAKSKLRMKSLRFDFDLLHHYQTTRSMDWLIKNPLLISRISYASSDYHDNNRMLRRHLAKTASWLFLIDAGLRKQNTLTTDSSFNLSTSQFNNFSTRDFWHYLVFYSESKRLVPRCIPLNDYFSSDLDLSRINIDILSEPSGKLLAHIDAVYQLLSDAYNRTSNPPASKKDLPWDFYDRVRRSVRYYVRSQQTQVFADKVLFLAIALESLFADNVKDNVERTLRRNLACILPDQTSEVYRIVKNLYESRSAIAHAGQAEECDTDAVRNLYFDALVSCASLLKGKRIGADQRHPFGTYAEAYISKRVGFLP